MTTIEPSPPSMEQTVPSQKKSTLAYRFGIGSIGVFALFLSFFIGIRTLPAAQTMPFVRDRVSIGIWVYSPETALSVMTKTNQTTPITEIYWDGGQRIHAIPESIGDLRALEILYIGGQPMTELPKRIGDLTALKYLVILNTPITKLPESIGNLTNLETLIVIGGRLKSLPASIQRLTNLRELNLSYNQLATIPDGLETLPNLLVLDVTGNRIRTLPNAFPPNAELIFLGSNPIPRSYFAPYDLKWPIYY